MKYAVSASSNSFKSARLPAHAQISHGLHREMLISSIDIDY
jgi:hypothetical protein